MTNPVRLRVLARKDPEAPTIWVAQTIEGDLVGQGPSLRAAMDDLCGVVVATLAGIISRGDGLDLLRAEVEDGDLATLFELATETGALVKTTPAFFASADAQVECLATWLHVATVEKGAADEDVEIASQGYRKQAADADGIHC